MESSPAPARPVQSTIAQPASRSYKTKIATVTPLRMRHQYESQPAGYLGISLENEHFTPAKLEAMIRWLKRKFESTAVLIGDSIHRITLETVRGLPSARAHETALRLGDEVVRTVDGLAAARSTRILRCSELQCRDDYKMSLRQLNDLFDGDEAFRSSVVRFSERFQRRNGLPGGALDWKVRRSCDYFLEEFAVFACLVSDGYGVMAYPGAFSTLSEIADGMHRGVPPELRELVVVSLDLKGRDRESSRQRSA